MVSGEARKGRNDSRDLSGREDATLGESLRPRETEEEESEQQPKSSLKK